MHSRLRTCAALLSIATAPIHDTLTASRASRATRAATVTGRVIDESARPVADADVRAVAVGVGAERRTRTDSAGRYVITFADAGDRVDVVVRHIGLRPAHFTLARNADAPDGRESLVGDVQLAPVDLFARVGG